MLAVKSCVAFDAVVANPVIVEDKVSPINPADEVLAIKAGTEESVAVQTTV